MKGKFTHGTLSAFFELDLLSRLRHKFHYGNADSQQSGSRQGWRGRMNLLDFISMNKGKLVKVCETFFGERFSSIIIHFTLPSSLSHHQTNELQSFIGQPTKLELSATSRVYSRTAAIIFHRHL